jgi:hypothetical protein
MSRPITLRAEYGTFVREETYILKADAEHWRQ